MVLTKIRRMAAAGALALTLGTPVLAAQSASRVQPTVHVAGVVDGNTIVETARRYLGVRYVLGGTTPKAFDCSGFIRYVFALHGLPLPRTAHEQAAYGVAPDERDLEPGDLLFFYGGRGAQHIAMYIGGACISPAAGRAQRVMRARRASPGSDAPGGRPRVRAARARQPRDRDAGAAAPDRHRPARARRSTARRRSRPSNRSPPRRSSYRSHTRRPTD